MNPVPTWGAILKPDLALSMTLNLQFAIDRAYVARRGPLPTFTNATTTARTYVGSNGLLTTAAINVPRIEFDPITGQCLGLLIEEQRQNLAAWSEDVTNAAWNKVGTGATGNTSVAPDGNSSADTVFESSTTTQHFFTSPPATVSSGTAYTASIFLKKGSGATAPDWVVLGNIYAGFGSRAVAFNVSTGAFGDSSGGLTGTSKQFQNGWWRVSFTSTATASGLHGSVFVGFTNNTNTTSILTYAGQTTSDIFVWGAQVEEGSFASSYIPTTTTSLVRSADVCSITGAAFTGFYNQTEGTIVFKGMKQGLQSGTPTYAQVDDGSPNNRLLLYKNTLGETYSVTTGGASQAFLGNATIVPANTAFGLATRYKTNDFALSLSGAAVSTNVSGTLPTVSQLTVGSRLGASFLSGWIRSFQYFNAIKTNAQLQALSTP